MQNKTLDFTAIKKAALKITFRDDTRIAIKTPNKKTMEHLVELGKQFDQANDGENGEVIEELYRACADIMSNNREKRKITPEYLEQQVEMDLEDLNLFFTAYIEFVSGITEIKN